MFGLEIIEVALGLAFTFLAISTVCSGIINIIIRITKYRAKQLKKALGKMLSDEGYNHLVKELYDHHMLTAERLDRAKDPEWIDTRHFSGTLFSVLTGGVKDSNQLAAARQKVEGIHNPRLRAQLIHYMDESAGNVDKFTTRLGNWFDNVMMDASNLYKHRMRLFVFGTSVVVVLSLNVDSLRISKMLWADDDLRKATSEAAQSFLQSYDSTVAEQVARPAPSNEADLDQDSTTFGELLEDVRGNVSKAHVLPIGWAGDRDPVGAFSDPDLGGRPDWDWLLLKFIGLFITIGAVSLGSSYWYNILRQLVEFRFGGKAKAVGGPGGGAVAVNIQAQSGSQVSVASPEGSSSGGGGSESSEGGGEKPELEEPPKEE